MKDNPSDTRCVLGIFVIIFILAIAIIPHCDKAHAETLGCFTQEQAAEFVYTLDKYQNCQDALGLCLNANNTCEQRMQAQDEVDRLKDEKIKIMGEIVDIEKQKSEGYAEIADIQKEKAEANKPTFWDDMSKRAEGAAIITIIIFVGIALL